MRVLFYTPFVVWTPHFATDLELALRHLEAGDEVHFLYCDRELHGCDTNPTREPNLCRYCRSKLDRGIEVIGLEASRVHRLQLERHFPRAMQLPRFESLQQLMEYRHGEVDVGAAVASSLVSRLREPDPPVAELVDEVQESVRTAIALYEATRQAIQRLQPDLFLVFNGRFASVRPALRAAMALGIPYRVHERGGSKERFVSVEGATPHDIEHAKREILDLWTSEGASSKEKTRVARRWYEERREGKDQGWFAFTRAQERGRLPDGFRPDRRNLVIYNSSEDEYVAVEGWENPLFSSQARALDFVLRASAGCDLDVYLRSHPNLKGRRNSQTRALASLRGPNLTVIPPETPVDTYALMDAATAVLTFGSTIGIEAVYWKRPSILVGRSFYEGLGGCYRPEGVEDLERWLRELPPPRPPERALPYAYWAQRRGEPYRYYEPRTLMEGRFLGRKIRGRLGPVLRLKFHQWWKRLEAG